MNNKVSYHIIKKFHNNSSDNDSKVAEYRSVCVHMEEKSEKGTLKLFYLHIFNDYHISNYM